jgi:hypothetical protein
VRTFPHGQGSCPYKAQEAEHFVFSLMTLSVYQASIIGTSILGILGALWMFMNMKFPRTAFSLLILSLGVTDLGTSIYAIYAMISAQEELPKTDQYFNYLFLDSGFFIALSISLLALKIVKYGYSIESFVWFRILLTCMIPTAVFLVFDRFNLCHKGFLQFLHCVMLSIGFIVLLLAYFGTLIELEAQKRLRQIAYEKGNIASRLMMRLLMCFGVLHIMFYLPHLALLWTEYMHEFHFNVDRMNYAFYIYEWVAMSCKGFFHALAICFVLLLKPSKVPVEVAPVRDTSVDTMSSDTVVLPPKAYERYERNHSPKFVTPLPPVSPTSSDTVLDTTELRF